MVDIERPAFEKRVDGVPLGDFHFEPPPAEEEAEGEPFQPRRESRGERELAVVIAHAAEARHRGDAGAREGGDVDSVARVVLEVAQVHLTTCLR